MVATAIIGSAVVGGITTAVSSSNAAHAQTQAANRASQVQQNMYNQTRSDLLPYQQQGLGAYSTLNDLLGAGANSGKMQSTLESLPGYQFTRDQGLKSVQNAYAARGLGDSGGALKGAATYATGLANSTYGNYVNQLQNSANLGESAAAQTGGYGVQTGQNVGSNILGAGNAQAAASNATGQAFAQGANNIGQYYTLNSLLNSTNQANNPSSGGWTLAGWNQST